MRKEMLLIVAIALFATSASIASAEDWPMFHHDLALSGYSPSTAPNTNDTLWIYDTGSDVRSSPAIVDGILYIGALDGKLYALNANTGSMIWNYTTGRAILSSPAVAGGKVYFGSGDGKVYALGGGAGGGSLIWSVGIGGAGWSSPAVHGGNVFIASESGKIFSLDASTGAEKWNRSIGGFPNGPIAVVNGKVYSGTHTGNPTLIALNEADGSVAWQYFHPGGGFVNSNGAAVVDGDGDGKLDVYFGVVAMPNGQAIALNEADGSLKWIFNFQPIIGAGPGPKGPGWSTSTPAVHNARVFIGSDDQNMYALDAGTGLKIWNFTTNACVWSAPAVADGKVFFGSNDHIFYALDETTGSLVWSYNTSLSRIEGSPAVADGKVYVGNENGKVYAFGHLVGNVTGGGWIPIQVIVPAQDKGKPQKDGKATFGFVAHYADGATTPSGNLEYNDHVIGMKVHGNVTTLSVNKATMTATFSGTAKITDASGTKIGTYTVTVVDNGEPGKNDKFGITLSTGYSAGPTTLGGGNIQIHKN